MVWHKGWWWLGGSLLLAVLWSNLVCFLRRPRSGAMGDFATRLSSWRFSPQLLQLLRLLYYIGLPYAALLLGNDALVQRYLGLTNDPASSPWLAWARDLGWAAAIATGTWILLAIGWWAYRRALAASGEESAVEGSDARGWVLLREAAYHEVHWAFYRNAPIVMLLGERYWGAWVGLTVVALEAALNPAWRKSLSHPQKSPDSLVRAALAVASTVLYWQTENLFLALLTHWIVSWGLSALRRASSGLAQRERAPAD